MHSEIATAVVLPGWTARHRRRPLAIALIALGVGAPVFVGLYVLFTSRSRVALSLDSAFLGIIVTVGAVAIVSRAVALLEVWVVAGKPTTLTRPELLASGAAIVGLLAGSVAVVEVGRARASIAPAFSSVAGEVLYDSERQSPNEVATGTTDGSVETPTTPPADASNPGAVIRSGTGFGVADEIGAVVTTSTLPPLPARPDSGVSAETLADVTTVLLLGGDSGPGRSGLRTDSMMVFSVHRPTGRASLVSLPRDLRRLLFPPSSALERRHPYGYPRIANAVYADVSSNRDLRSAYDVEGVRPGIVALAQAIGYSLDVTIDDYVLVDMQGFADLVDALGGVTLLLTKKIPMPGNVPGARTQYPDSIGPGVVSMDGATALGYARSRKGDNDYRRARRQRDLLATLARQISVSDVALSFGDIAGAIGGSLRTSLTPDELADAVAVIGGETAIVESVGLVPPLVNVRRPDFDAMAKIVGAVHTALVTGESSGY